MGGQRAAYARDGVARMRRVRHRIGLVGLMSPDPQVLWVI
jgi:hypothetical protein